MLGFVAEKNSAKLSEEKELLLSSLYLSSHGCMLARTHARTHARTLNLAEFLSAWGGISSDGSGGGGGGGGGRAGSVGGGSWEQRQTGEEREHIYSGRLHERPASVEGKDHNARSIGLISLTPATI